MKNEIDFETSARIGFAALLERIDLMLERGEVSYDDYNDIEDIGDVLPSSTSLPYRSAIYGLSEWLRDRGPMGAPVQLSPNHRVCLAFARNQRAFVDNALDGWRQYEAGVRARQPQFNPGVDSFMDWLICSGLIQNLCIGIQFEKQRDE